VKVGIILGDQLSLSLPTLQALDKTRDRLVMAEVPAEATYVGHHKQKIAFIFSAMRHFAADLREAGWQLDYLAYGEEKPGYQWDMPRYAVVYHLLSIKNNERLRLKCFLDGDMPKIDSVVDIWAGADWFEREAFDMFGIVFDGHPDLRRILTDYGFIGHPFRKDFPLSGHVEMRYDPEQKRVIYQPVSIEPRVLVPRVIREEGFGG